jgi:hypothetical protein
VDHDLDPVAQIVVTEDSPDNLISATLSHQDKIAFRFRPGSYQLYDEAALGRQLGQLITNLWDSFRQRYFQSLSAALGETIRGDEREDSPKLQRFKDAQSALRSGGDSGQRWVRIESQGMRHWRVTLGRNALRQLTEQELIAEVDAALRAAINDYYAQLVALKDEYFDLRLPKEQRDGSRRSQHGENW